MVFSMAFSTRSSTKSSDTMKANRCWHGIRRTVHYLFEQGLSPLSTIENMIGSWVTKGMNVLARFEPEVVECGESPIGF